MPDDIEPSQPASSQTGLNIPAMLVGAPEGAEQRSTPVYGWLWIGRECPGVDERHRLLIDDPAVSRTHLEIRLDFELDQAWLTDHSTNGTRLNGRRIERSVPVRIKPGDRVRLGETELHFRSPRFASVTIAGGRRGLQELNTLRQFTVMEMVLVVGDILGFSTIAEHTDDLVLLENVDRLYAELRRILARYRGTLSNYVGDAFFATWETDAVPDAAGAAVAFAVDVTERMPRIAAGLDLRDPGGGPLRMGWGVSSGPAAVSQLTGMLVTVVGDAANVAFRLSAIAGRDGWADVLVTGAVHEAAAKYFAFTPPTEIQVKGRTQPVQVLGASRL